MIAPKDPNDPTQMRNQPALTTSSGRSWLLLGGILAGVSAILLASMLSFEPAGVALFGLVTVIVLYAAMVTVRLSTHGRLRLRLLATLMIAIAVVGLGCVLILAASGGAQLGTVNS